MPSFRKSIAGDHKKKKKYTNIVLFYYFTKVQLFETCAIGYMNN